MRLALAGYAYGRTLHAPLIRQAGGEIVAIATRDPERVTLARADHPAARVVPDLDALLIVAREVAADAVVLVTPTGRHAEHVRAVIDAALPCVVDKPLAVDGDTSAALVAQAHAARVPLTVFHNRRYDDGPRALSALVREGALGELLRFEMRYERWRPEPKHRWREDAPWQEGGGVLLDLGPHVIDTAVRFLGPVTSVDAEIAARTTTADDDVFLHLRHARGGSSVVTASSVTPAPGPRLRVTGTRAGFLLDDSDEGCSYPDLRNAPGCAGWLVAGAERRPAPLPDGGQADFYRQLAAALALPAGDYDSRRRALPVDPDDAVHTARVIDAARVSAAEGRTVALARPWRGTPPASLPSHR